MKLVAAVLGLGLLCFAAPAQATEIVEVTSEKGIKAWLVEDHKLPLIALNLAFRGGVEQDPSEKQGLATLVTALLTQGAGPYDATQFQDILASHSIGIRFSAGRDALYGEAKMLAEEKSTAFELVHLALTQPRFEPKEIERARTRQFTQQQFQLGSPEWQARFALLGLIFKNHPYDQRSLGSRETLHAIGAEDIRGFVRSHLARENLVVAVAGDISPDELKVMLDRTFGDLPEKADLASIPEVAWPAVASSILVPRAGTQTVMLFAKNGPKREDADWYAAQIADYILGAGGFSSLLMQEVRDKNGLTYGISTALAPMDHGAMIIGDASTDNPKTAKAWSITLDVWRKFFKDGATQDQIQAAKDYITGSLPLTMTSRDAIAGALISLQLEHLDRDYLARHDSLVRQVSDDDLKGVIQKWFDPAALSFVMVGSPDGITATKTQSLVTQ